MVSYMSNIFLFFFRIAITKLDILDVFEEIKIGVAYWIGDRKVEDSFPGRYQMLPWTY